MRNNQGPSPLPYPPPTPPLHPHPHLRVNGHELIRAVDTRILQDAVRPARVVVKVACDVIHLSHDSHTFRHCCYISAGARL